MISVEEYCKKNGFNDEVTFLITAAVEYDKNKFNQPWLKTAAISRYDSEIFSTIERMIRKSDEKEIVISTEEMIPKHYTDLTIEPIKFIEDNNLGFSAGNAVKYLSRLSKKDSCKKELAKCYFYFDMIINGTYENAKEMKEKGVI